MQVSMQHYFFNLCLCCFQGGGRLSCGIVLFGHNIVNRFLSAPEVNNTLVVESTWSPNASASTDIRTHGRILVRNVVAVCVVLRVIKRFEIKEVP